MISAIRTLFAVALAASLSNGCTAGTESGQPSPKGGTKMAFVLESKAFKSGESIPRRHTCEGEDLSPALYWSEPPAGTRSLALIADDPDAPVGTWVHWVLYNLEPGLRGLPEGVSKAEEVQAVGKQGLNDFRKVGYGGPCPPPGKPHRYFFRLYALDTSLAVNPRATKQEVERAMKGHILAQTDLMGRYKR